MSDLHKCHYKNSWMSHRMEYVWYKSYLSGLFKFLWDRTSLVFIKLKRHKNGEEGIWHVVVFNNTTYESIRVWCCRSLIHMKHRWKWYFCFNCETDNLKKTFQCFLPWPYVICLSNTAVLNLFFWKRYTSVNALLCIWSTT